MLEGVLADVRLRARIICGTPEQSSGVEIPGMLRHIRSQDLHERMGAGNFCSPCEGFSRFFVIVQLDVVDKAEIVIKPPVLRIVFDAISYEPNSTFGLARAGGRSRSQKAGSKLVSRQHLGIKRHRDLQQRG